MRKRFRILKIKKTEAYADVEAENMSDAVRLLVQDDKWLRWHNGDWKESISIEEIKDGDGSKGNT